MTKPSDMLLIGLPDIHGMQSIRWSQISGCNAADYDVVILDCETLIRHLQLLALEDLDIFDKYVKTLEWLGSRIAKRVASNGTVVVIRPRELHVRVPREGFSHSGSGIRNEAIYDALDWFPIVTEIKRVEGKTSIVHDPRWERYFSKLDTWDFHFAQSEIVLCRDEQWSEIEPLQESFIGKVKPLATNRAGEPLGIEAYNFGNLLVDGRYEAIDEPGQLFMVPSISSIDSKQAVDLILEDLFDYSFSSDAPEWTKSVYFPGLSDIDDDMQKVESQIENLNSRLKGLNKKRQALTKWLGLLYESGTPLQDLCEDAFRELGADTTPSPVSDEFVVIVDGKEMLVEVKGVGKSANKGHIGQLLTDNEQDGENRFYKLALVVNAWKDLPLNERGSNDKPWFPDNIHEMAIPANIVLISSLDLFDALVGHWTSKNGKASLESMLGTSGRLRP